MRNFLNQIDRRASRIVVIFNSVSVREGGDGVVVGSEGL